MSPKQESPLHAKDLQSLLDKAEKAVDEDDYAQAASIYKKIWPNFQNDRFVHFNFALALYKTGKLKKSLKLWLELKNKPPHGKFLYLNLGCAYDELGQPAMATRCWKKELELFPSSTQAAYNLGFKYYRAHQYKKALPYLKKCFLGRHEPFIKVAEATAWTFFKTGDLEAEEMVYQECLFLDRNDVWALNGLGAVLMSKGEFSRAQVYLLKAQQLDANDPLVIHNLAKVKQQRRRRHRLKNSSEVCPT